MEISKARLKAERDHQDLTDHMTIQMRQLLKEEGKPTADMYVRAEVRLQDKVQADRDRVDRLQWMEENARLMCSAFEQRQGTLMKLKAM